jgi:hypothetical protein
MCNPADQGGRGPIKCLGPIQRVVYKERKDIRFRARNTPRLRLYYLPSCTLSRLPTYQA